MKSKHNKSLMEIKLDNIIKNEINNYLKEDMDGQQEMDIEFKNILQSMIPLLKLKVADVELKQKNDIEVKKALKKSPALAKIANESINRKKKIGESQSQSINEIDTAVIVSLALTLPKIAEIIAILIEKITKKLGGGDKNKVADWLKKRGHDLHEVYFKIVKLMLMSIKVYRKSDSDTRNKMALIVYHLIVAGIAVYSGVSAVQAGFSATGGLEGAMAAIKGNQVIKYLSEKFSSILYKAIDNL